MKNFFCLLAVLLVPTIAFSQTGTIEGTVYNQDTKEALGRRRGKNSSNRYTAKNR